MSKSHGQELGFLGLEPAQKAVHGPGFCPSYNRVRSYGRGFVKLLRGERKSQADDFEGGFDLMPAIASLGPLSRSA